MTLTGVTVGPCYLFYLPQRSRNGPKFEILMAKSDATPSKNVCLGRVLINIILVCVSKQKLFMEL